MMEMNLEYERRQNNDGNPESKEAGQTTMQMTDRKRNANWLQRWVLITALTIFPACAFALSDLVMTGVSSTTTTYNSRGGQIYISDTVRNQGTSSLTNSVKIGYYLSTDNVITTTDTFLGYRWVSSLAAGASSATTSAPAYVPAGLAAGTYYLGAIADYTGLEPETDETNNALSGTVIMVTVPDLVMMAVSSTTTQVNTLGGGIYITDTLKNQGSVASTVGARVGYYLSTDNVITSADTVIGYRYTNPLAAGASSANTTGITANIPAGLPLGGTYHIGAIADDTSLQPETDETNNAVVGTAITVTKPDLVMTAVSSTTTILPTSGGSILINFTQKNQGAVASTVSDRVGFYLSTDNVITTADTFIGSQYASRLAAGASGVSGVSVTVPTGLAPGTYYLGAIADYTGLEPETDETNNAFAGTTITVTLPDVVVTAVGASVTKVPLGGGIGISFTVKNQGAVSTTGAPYAGFYLSTDNVITTADTLIGSNGQAYLNAGQSFVVNSVGANIPAGLAPGFYYLGVIADYTGMMPETDEANNALVGPMIAVGLPDLTMTAISTSSTAVIPGSSFTVADTLKNQGTSTTTTGCRSVGYYLSTDTTITAADALIGSRQQCGALAAGASSSAAATSVTVPSNMAIGTYYFGMIADYAGQEVESDETNNILAGAAVLLALVPDAPVNAAATGGPAKATVTFNAPANNGGTAITGYTVTSSPAGGVDSNAGSTGLSHVITGLVNGTAYTFTVTATNAVGTSLPSAASNSVTPALAVPDAPLNVHAAGGATQATVTFNAPANDGGTAITGYTVTSSPAGLLDGNAGTTGLSHSITGLVSGTTYTFTVTATNAVGTSLPSAPSNSVTANTTNVAKYYIHADHLDTPRQITDTAGNTVWQWDNSDPFGNNPPNENPSGAGQFSFNLRFPGQYADRETNTYYNINRDYDPSVGRYIQSDPIGLAGGTNTYTYVRDNPLSGVDPYGLLDFVVGPFNLGTVAPNIPGTVSPVMIPSPAAVSVPGSPGGQGFSSSYGLSYSSPNASTSNSGFAFTNPYAPRTTIDLTDSQIQEIYNRVIMPIDLTDTQDAVTPSSCTNH